MREIVCEGILFIRETLLPFYSEMQYGNEANIVNNARYYVQKKIRGHLFGTTLKEYTYSYI